MHDKNQPLPSHEEVHICTHETTAEEVSVSRVVSCVYHLRFHYSECPPLNSKYNYKRFSKPKRDDFNTIWARISAKNYGPFLKEKKNYEFCRKKSYFLTA